MLPFKEVMYVDSIEKNKEHILATDIGGTNSNFGIFQFINGNPKLQLSIHIKSKEIKQFTLIVADILAYLQKKHGINIQQASFAAAGVASENKDYAKPTNLDIEIDTHDIVKKTNLNCAFVVNDFEIIGYGLSSLDPKNLIKVNNQSPNQRANKAILGAGTGLGKCIMVWNKERNDYIPCASEGGHADFAPQNELEFELIKFIQKTENRPCNISWEDVLSGYGIARIYNFFHKKNGNNGIANSPHPDEIFNSKDRNKDCKKTFELYTTFYARCAKNFALDALALGGIYIAGGIAAKNLALFQLPCFLNEFTNCGKQQKLLKTIPIYVITDYNVSLYGAAAYMKNENMCNK